MRSKISNHQVQHLLNRSILGNSISDERFKTIDSIPEAVDLIFNACKPYKAFDLVMPEVSMELIMNRKKGAEARAEARKKSNMAFKNLNVAWMKEMLYEKTPINERLAFFWHDHFACRSTNSYHMQQYLNIIRRNALGNFGAMLLEVSKSPAMLSFLNNQQNRLEHPNENFAREVMELFTLGIGHYTEVDVKEGARAFTGWSFDRQTNTFEFKDRWHDSGTKTFLGQTGNFKGEDIIAIILKQKQTALYITEKIWKFFVNENPNQTVIKNLAQKFYDTNYEITPLLKSIFTSDAFYEKKNIGALIKSPVELIVQISRQLGLEWLNETALIKTQRILGQVLMLPPNVAGWKGGAAWIDSSSLILRMDLAHTLLIKNDVPYQPKEEAEVFDSNKAEAKPKKTLTIDWLRIEKHYGAAYQAQTLVEHLLSYPPNLQDKKQYYKDNLKETMVHIMGLPEYQLI
jgi:uncharacterized protein (DUF1800 family)